MRRHSPRSQFFGARDTGVPSVPYTSHSTEATAAAIPKLAEGKKFFLAPSLTTGAGAKSERATNRHTTNLDIDAAPMKTITLHYETAGTLLLRGILRRDVAAHAAILDACPGTEGGTGHGAAAAVVAGPMSWPAAGTGAAASRHALTLGTWCSLAETCFRPEEEEAGGSSAVAGRGGGSRAGQRVKRERGPPVEVDLTVSEGSAAHWVGRGYLDGPLLSCGSVLLHCLRTPMLPCILEH